MGVETDYLLATHDQKEDVLAALNPAKDFAGVYGKGTDPISLGALLGAFAGNGSGETFLDEFPFIGSTDDGEKSICRVSDRLRRFLEEMKTASIPEIVALWMATEDFQLTGWDATIATEFIADLKSMLARDDAKKKELWMVISV